jgi:hypothetical protein
MAFPVLAMNRFCKTNQRRHVLLFSEIREHTDIPGFFQWNKSSFSANSLKVGQ